MESCFKQRQLGILMQFNKVTRSKGYLGHDENKLKVNAWLDLFKIIVRRLDLCIKEKNTFVVH